MRTIICLALFGFATQIFSAPTFAAQITATTNTSASCHDTYKKALATYKAEIARARTTIDTAYKAAQTTITENQTATAEAFKSCHAQAAQNYDQRIRQAKSNQDSLATIKQHELESKKCGTDFAENIAETYSLFAEEISRAQTAFNNTVTQARTAYDVAVTRCP